MIVGTAGHIDHGKSTLVRALTGVDTDRLPEEKRRGISIELGYAFLDAGEGRRIGFIDVPGHERLVHTMVAGATGIDFALLLVAADDGVMPQTREHLAVLSLLGIARGAVVITKADRVEADRLAAVQAQAAALLKSSSLAGSPVLAVSAVSGEGVTALKQLLLDAAAQTRGRSDADAGFRLAVDRAFTLDGVGTVVTGSVHAGQVRVGDELQLVPGSLRARVRSLHAQNEAREQAQAGQRCALALVGLAKEQVARGQWLCPSDCALQTERLDAELTLWHEESKALRSGERVHLHIGSASTLASLALLDGERLAPGQTARVQLVLQQPLAAWRGDRLVLRDGGASRTLAGGRVLDPFAPTRYRRTPERLAQLDALALPAAQERLHALLATSPLGVDLLRLQAAEARSLPPLPSDALLAEGWALGSVARKQAEALLLAQLERFHERQPDQLGPDAARLRRFALPRLSEPLFKALLARLLSEGRVQQRGACLHLPAHGILLTANETRIAQKAAPWLLEAGFEGAWVRDLAKQCNEPEALMRSTLARLAQQGELHQVVKDLYYPLATMATLAGLARQSAAGGAVTAAAFRDATQLGRKRAIQILEHFDRVGLLRRVGDEHRLRADSDLFAEAA